MQSALRSLMEQQLGPIRTHEGIGEAMKTIKGMLSKMEKVSLASQSAADLYSMLIIAFAVTEGAYARQESVGAHYIEHENL